jgi:hypothetical protein
MRFALSAFALLIVLAGCTREPDAHEPAPAPSSQAPAEVPVSDAFEGVWSGNVYENGEVMPVEFELKLDDGKYGGTFRLLGEGKEEEFEILQAQVKDNWISFILPIEGKIDSEAVKVDLELKRNTMAGRMKEMKEGKKPIAVSFKRKKTQ